MGDVGLAAAPPRAMAPAPRTRRGAAPAPAAPHPPRALEVLAGGALCCSLGMLLVCNVTSAVVMATRRAFGRDSPAAAAAGETFLIAAAYLLYFALMALVCRLLDRGRKRELREEAPVVGGVGDPTRPAARRRLAERIGARGRQDQDALYGPVTGPIYFVSCVLMVVGFLMLMLAPAKSWAQSAGYMVADLMVPSLCCVLLHHLLSALVPVEVYLCQVKGGLKGGLHCYFHPWIIAIQVLGCMSFHWGEKVPKHCGSAMAHGYDIG